MAFRIIDIDHQLESVRDMNCMGIDILTAFFERFGQRNSGLEHVSFIFQCGTFSGVVVKSDARIFGKVHLCSSNLALVGLHTIRPIWLLTTLDSLRDLF